MALDNDEVLSTKHLQEVLFVRHAFIENLQGPGYEEAKKLYL